MTIKIEWQDQHGNWHHYQTKRNQADAYRVAQRRAESTNSLTVIKECKIGTYKFGTQFNEHGHLQSTFQSPIRLRDLRPVQGIHAHLRLEMVGHKYCWI